MNVMINGEDYVVPKHVKTIRELVDHIGFDSPVIIAEHNGTILQKEEHQTAMVNTGDQIEFIQFVGGG